MKKENTIMCFGLALIRYNTWYVTNSSNLSTSKSHYVDANYNTETQT